jgi:protein O-mannosyl-transferase
VIVQIVNHSTKADSGMVRPQLRISICLVLLTLLVFFRMLGHGFIELDDREYVTENTAVQSGLSGSSLAWAFTTGYAGNWHPVTWLSHMIDFQFWGMNAGGHHAVSLLLHILNVLLLFLVLSRMTGGVWKSGFAAALFAIHPLHVESVAWIAERKDVLSGFFWLLTMEAYRTSVAHPRPLNRAMVVAWFGLGLMAKPMLVTLPFVLLLLDYWPLARVGVGRKSWLAVVLEKLPLIALAVVSSVITLIVQRQGGAVASLSQFPFELRLSNALVSCTSYLVKMVWPVGLSVYYSYRTAVPAWEIAASAVFLVVVSVAVVIVRRRCPYLLVGWFWFLVTLVPVIGLVQVGAQAMADRYSYIPLIGPFIMLAWGIPDLVNAWAPAMTSVSQKSRALAAAAVAVIFGLSAAAFVQVGYWRDGATLLKRAVVLGADNPLINYNLGLALAKQDRIEEAIECYEKTLHADSASAVTHVRIAELQAGLGRMDEAVGHLNEVIRLRPGDASARNNLAITLANLGRKGEALVQFREAARLSPNDMETQYNLAFALADQGLYQESAEQCRRILRLDPDWPPAAALVATVEERLRDSERGRPSEVAPK